MNAEALKELRDIKPPVEVPDHSLWLLLAVVAGVLALGLLLWRLASRRHVKRRRRRKSPEEIARERLSAIDYDDTKGAVYTFGEYLPTLIGEDEEAMRAFEALQARLARYKYKKEVPPLRKEDVEAMKRLVKKGLSHG
jgi:hypothetical protein